MDAPDSLTVPSSWVHVDLQKLRARLEAQHTSDRVNELKTYQTAMSLQMTNLERSTARRQKRLEHLKEELQSLTAEQDEEIHLQEMGRRVAEGTRNQAYYQKSTSKTYYVPSVTASSSASLTTVMCPLTVYGFDVLQGCYGQSSHPNEEGVGAFLKFCAPLFQWNADEEIVKAPFFFDEPCLLERCASEVAALAAPSSSSASTPPASPTSEDRLSEMQCRNAACAYWHCDQLAHMRMAVQFFILSLQEACVSDEGLCCVRGLLSRLARQVDRADSVTLVCALMCEVLQTLIGLGLYVPLMEGKKLHHDLAAPRLRSADVKLVDPLLSTMLPRSEVRERLEQLAQRHKTVPKVTTLCFAAVEAFQQYRDAVSWRCLLACVDKVAQRHWLARQGIQLFPRCPQLHLVYIQCCLLCGASMEKVEEACLTSCRTLSAQAAAAVVAGLDGGQYGTTVARHIGYIITIVFVHFAKTNATRALQFLSPLLSTDAEVGLAALLLPIARQNLALMSVALRRVGHLRGVEDLPLAAVSDQVFALASPDGGNPPESGRDVVYASFRLINAYKRDHFDPYLTTACAGALQLSLLRTFAHRLSYLERVAEKTEPASALGQGILYGVYVEAIAQQESVSAAVTVAEALAAAEGATCFLTLWLRSQLRTWGYTTPLNAAHAVKQLCAAEELPIETLDSADGVRVAAATHREVSAVEWVAAYALRLRYKDNAATAEGDCQEREATDVWTAMLAFPVEVLAADTVAAMLYFSLLLQQSAALHHTFHFYTAVRRCLSFFREVHVNAWDPLDASYASMVGLPHYVGLLIYKEVPRLLGAQARATLEWRRVALAAAAELEVLHPLLVAE